jgi:hypothetical protein
MGRAYSTMGKKRNACKVKKGNHLGEWLWVCSPLLGPGRFSVSSSFTQSVVILERGIRPSQGRYRHRGQHKHRIPQVGFESTTPVFERAKAVHALNIASTVIDTDSSGS